MSYCINGTNITSFCELAWGSADTRGKALINTSNYWFDDNTMANSYPDQQFISYVSGYLYSAEALNGKYKKAGSALQISAKGYRPGYKFRYSASNGTGGYIKKFAEGDIWLGGTLGVRDGTQLCATSNNWNWIFTCYCGGGAGGGGGSATASAGGGGGGGGYIFAVFRLFAGRKMTYSAGWAGSAGGGNGAGDWIVKKRNSFAVAVDKIRCDYYDFLNGDVAVLNTFSGEYMFQYSWAEMTNSRLCIDEPVR